MKQSTKTWVIFFAIILLAITCVLMVRAENAANLFKENIANLEEGVDKMAGEVSGLEGEARELSKAFSQAEKELTDKLTPEEILAGSRSCIRELDIWENEKLEEFYQEYYNIREKVYRGLEAEKARFKIEVIIKQLSTGLTIKGICTDMGIDALDLLGVPKNNYRDN